MPRHWDRQGDRFTTRWGYRDWDLDLGADHIDIGLYESDSADSSHGVDSASYGVDSALKLCHLSDTVGGISESFHRRQLVSIERRFEEVRATYRFPDAGGLTVAATWSLFGDHGVDLMIHIQADSVDRLTAVEISVGAFIATREIDTDTRTSFEPAEPGIPSPFPGDHPESGIPSPFPGDHPESADFLDARPANRILAPLGVGIVVGEEAYDHPSSASQFHVLEPPANRIPAPFVVDRGVETYVEFVRPTDWSSRLFLPGRAMHTALFGHALEKGVALRGRVRGLFLPGPLDERRVKAEHDLFLSEPPPLGP